MARNPTWGGRSGWDHLTPERRSEIMRDVIKKGAVTRAVHAADFAERFWRRVEKTEGCWLWTGFINPKTGYGSFWREGKGVSAHRVSWELANGPLAEGEAVLHKCDVRACVRPDHLFKGDAAANMQDCIAKGRLPFGSGLSPAQVLEARHRVEGGESRRSIARGFGVTKSTVARAVRGDTYRSIGE